MSLIGRCGLTLAALPLAACLVFGDGGPADPPPADPLAGYRALAAELAAGRTEIVAAGAYTLMPAADRLFWVDHQGVPSLHGQIDATGARTDYRIDLGPPEASLVVASASLIVTGLRDGDAMVIRAWRTDGVATVIGELVVPAPPGDISLWPVAVDGDAVWFTRDQGAGAALWRWRPAATDPGPVAVMTLADAHPALARVDALGVALGLAVVVESGRVWRVELATGAATWVRASTEAIGGVSIDPTGLLVETADALLWLPARATEPVDVGAAIARVPMMVPFYLTGHHLTHGAALRKGQVVYLGQVGVFRYDLLDGTLAPLALVPHDPNLRIDFRQPTWLDTGAVHVLGLTSTSGAVGATGPIFRIAGGAS